MVSSRVWARLEFWFALSVLEELEFLSDLSADEAEEDLSVGGLEKMSDQKKEPTEASLLADETRKERVIEVFVV